MTTRLDERLRNSAAFQALIARYPFLKRIPVWGWGLLALIAIFLAAISLTPTPAGASNPNIPGATTVGSIQLFGGVLVKLGMVIGLIYASLYLLRRWKGALPGAQERRLSVVETLRLSPRQSLHLVQVGDQILLVGATDQALTLLSEIDPVIDPLKDNHETEAAVPAVPDLDFSAALKRVRRIS